MKHQNKHLLLNIFLTAIVLWIGIASFKENFFSSYADCGSTVIPASPGQGIVSLLLLTPLLFLIIKNIGYRPPAGDNNRWYMSSLVQIIVALVLIVIITVINSNHLTTDIC